MRTYHIAGLLLLSACSSAEVVDHTAMDHSEHMMMDERSMDHDMVMETLEVFDRENPPYVSITVTEDQMAGWNIQLTTENFAFAPQHASLGHLDGEGHAHIYIDKEKIARVYGNWYHLDMPLAPGVHKVQVTLNTNDHRQLTIDGQPVGDSTYITVTK